MEPSHRPRRAPCALRLLARAAVAAALAPACTPHGDAASDGALVDGGASTRQPAPPDASAPDGPAAEADAAPVADGGVCATDADCNHGQPGLGVVCASSGADAGRCVAGCHSATDCPSGDRCDTSATPHWACVPDGDAATDAAADGSGCGEFAGDTTPTCSKDGTSLGSCASGVESVEVCPNGCLRASPPAPSSCLLSQPTNFSCTGAYGTTPVDDGNYYLTSFGCYIDGSGAVQTDPGDNCIPSCLSEAQSSGLCAAGSSGPACEESVTWYVADGARFGCLARLRITNPANGKSVVAVALDFGPACSVENGVSHAVLDASGRIDDYLFGGEEGATDRATVHVVQVDGATPLGPM